MKVQQAIFAKRTDWDLHPNRLTTLVEELKRQGEQFLDLTESNPTKADLQYPQEIFSRLGEPAPTYDPSPKGLLEARQAVSLIYAGKGPSISPEDVFLTASTSEAYSFLFRLLADGGDEILVPCPSYPLFGYLAGLHDVQPVPYGPHLQDLPGLISQRTKAIIAVHPNNPTGACLTRKEADTLVQICRDHGLALISDEVFAEYIYKGNPDIPKTLLAESEVLTFSLGGLSKFMGLPQMKLAWMAATGPPNLRRDALARLEVIADAFLSVATPIQRAFPGCLPMAAQMQDQIRQRLATNRKKLKEEVISCGKQVVLPESQGGWSAVIQVPSLRDEEDFVVKLLQEERALIHPGYFFDFGEPGFLVLSLLPRPDLFQEGIKRIFSRL